MVTNLPANAGDMGSIAGPGRSHAAGQLSLCAATTQPVLKSLGATSAEEPMLYKGSHHSKWPTHHHERSCLLAQLEKSLCSGEDPAQQN